MPVVAVFVDYLGSAFFCKNILGVFLLKRTSGRFVRGPSRPRRAAGRAHTPDRVMLSSATRLARQAQSHARHAQSGLLKRGRLRTNGVNTGLDEVSGYSAQRA